MKKILCAFLALLMLFAVSCSEAGSDGTATTADASAGATENGTPEETVPANERDTLPDKKFPGETYTILSRKNTAYEILSDGITGDLVNDAVFTRNGKVEERFGVKIEVLQEPGDWGDRTSFVKRVENVYMSGTESYDLIMTHSAYIVDIGIQGFAYDMNTLDQIDFEKKWWCPAYTKNVNIDGMIYSAIGDLTYSLYERMQCIFFNKTLTAEYSIPDLYELAQNNEWTFAKLQEITMAAGKDADGNGVYDTTDIYGLGFNGHSCRALQTSFDTQMTVPDGDGRQKINLPNEKYINVYNETLKFVRGNNHVRFDNEADNQVQMFMDGNLMLFAGRLGNAVRMKDMTSEYGIVPFPKYNADQADYISCARDYMTAMCIFGKLKNPEKTAVVTEALCMYGYQLITPAYYETTLKYKVFNDPIAMNMLDRIRDTLTFDFAMTYTNQLNLLFSTMGDNIQNNVASISNLLKGQTVVIQKAIDNLYESYEKLK